MGGHNRRDTAKPIKPWEGDYDFRQGHFRRKCIPTFTTAEDYADDRIRILIEDFDMDLTNEDKKYIRSFKSQGEINAAVKRIINKYWDRE